VRAAEAQLMADHLAELLFDGAAREPPGAGKPRR
jgi:hypothetical protein